MEELGACKCKEKHLGHSGDLCEDKATVKAFSSFCAPRVNMCESCSIHTFLMYFDNPDMISMEEGLKCQMV